MKYKGSTTDFAPQRNAALIRCYRHHAALMRHISLRQLARRIVDSPAPRFWVSEERAAAVLSAIDAGRPVLDGMIPTKREMFREIHRRVCALRALRPDLSQFDCVYQVVNSPAPRFYMTPRSVIEIIYRIRHGRYKSHD